MTYNIMRAGAVVASIVPDGKQSKKIMDVNVVDMTFTLSYMVDFAVGDYIIIDNETYDLLNVVPVNKVSSIEFAYTLQFKGWAYKLAKVVMLGLDGANQYTQPIFSVMGTADVIIDLVIANANRDYAGWVKGAIDDTAAQNFSFTGEENCLSTLATLATTYNLEWWVDGQTIHMTKVGSVENIDLEYGKGKGLYEIDRAVDDSKNYITRLYACGSSDNIPSTYRNYSKNLMLPDGQICLESNIYVDNDPAKGKKYGIIEDVQVFDDIKPEYKGTVLSSVDNFNFIDPGIDFDINAQQLATAKPKVSFLSGQLQGYSFEVGGWDNATKRVTILKNEDEKDLDLPSDLMHPQPGDTYTFVDINMPLSYISDAEHRLLIAAQNYLDQNDTPFITYTVTCDPFNFKKRNLTLTLGNYIRVRDAHFKLDQDIRITGLTRDLQNKFSYTIDLQEVVSAPQIVRQYTEYAGIKSAVNQNKLSDPNKMRASWRNIQELKNKIYDPDGNYFDMDNIRPLSIETLMLSVGAKSQQFILQGVTVKANFSGQASQLAYTSGALIHYTLFSTPYTWNIAGALITGLSDPTAYYIYAKCGKADNTGSIILTVDTVATEGIAGYYCFWIGVLHSVIDGVRGISLTYGQTTINGRFVTTGVIQSADGETYFDLDQGEIGGRIKFLPGSSGYDNLNDKPDLSNMADVDYVNAIKKDLQNQIDGQITSWFYDYEPTLTNEPAVEWLTTDDKNNHLGDLFYWSSKGYAYRFSLISGVYSWETVADTDILLALQKAKDAQDTAESKRRTFSIQPYPPYDVGDLWAQGASGDLMKCINGRVTGVFVASDWDKASKYTDDTKANQAAQDAADAKANADNALETANTVATLTDFLATTIDGNVIATGTLLVGDATHNNAGITGVTDNGQDSVRFWAGASYANRYSAPFRVTDKGSVTLQSSATGKRIVIDGANNNLKFVLDDGTEVIKIDSAVAWDGVQFNDPPNPPTDKYGPGILIGSLSGTYSSIGRLGIRTGFIYATSINMNGTDGKTEVVQYRLNNSTYAMHFDNGIYTGNTLVTA